MWLLQGAAPGAADCADCAEPPVLWQCVLLWARSCRHVPVPRAERPQGTQHLQQQVGEGHGSSSSSCRRGSGACSVCWRRCCWLQLQWKAMKRVVPACRQRCKKAGVVRVTQGRSMWAVPWAVCQTGALTSLWQGEGGAEGVVFTPKLFAESGVLVMHGSVVCTYVGRCTEIGCHLTCTWHDCGGGSAR